MMKEETEPINIEFTEWKTNPEINKNAIDFTIEIIDNTYLFESQYGWKSICK